MCDMGIHTGDLVWVIHAPAETAKSPSSCDLLWEPRETQDLPKLAANFEAAEEYKHSDQVRILVGFRR